MLDATLARDRVEKIEKEQKNANKNGGEVGEWCVAFFE